MKEIKDDTVPSSKTNHLNVHIIYYLCCYDKTGYDKGLVEVEPEVSEALVLYDTVAGPDYGSFQPTTPSLLSYGIYGGILERGKTFHVMYAHLLCL